MKTYCVRKNLAAAIVVLTGSLGGCDIMGQKGADAGGAGKAEVLPADVTRWSVDNVEMIGGQKPQVLGAPKVTSDAMGKAVSFDGVKDGLIFPVVPLAGMKAFTLEVLFRPETGGPTEQRFMHSEDEAGHRMTIETRLTPEGKWYLDTFLLNTNTVRLTLIDPTKLHPANEWYWVALRYDGTTMSDFVNGVKELEGAVNFSGDGGKGAGIAGGAIESGGMV